MFEPLLYSRTRKMASELGAALSAADEVVVLDVFAGSEAGEDHADVGRLVADAVAGPPAVWAGSLETARRHLETTLRAGDVCVVMGVGEAPHELAQTLAAHG